MEVFRLDASLGISGESSTGVTAANIRKLREIKYYPRSTPENE